MSAAGAANTLLWIIIIIVAVVLLIVILDRFVLMAAPIGFVEGQGVMPKLFYLL
jgi:flagellar basal body-associated protein FliL